MKASQLLLRIVSEIQKKKTKKATANGNKAYLDYLNKLLDQDNNTCHRPIYKKPVDTDNSGLTALSHDY